MDKNFKIDFYLSETAITEGKSSNIIESAKRHVDMDFECGEFTLNEQSYCWEVFGSSEIYKYIEVKIYPVPNDEVEPF